MIGCRQIRTTNDDRNTGLKSWTDANRFLRGLMRQDGCRDRVKVTVTWTEHHDIYSVTVGCENLDGDHAQFSQTATILRDASEAQRQKILFDLAVKMHRWQTAHRGSRA